VSTPASVRVGAAAIALVVFGAAGCGGGRPSYSATPRAHSASPRAHPSPCAQLTVLSPELVPVLADLHEGRINLVTNIPVRRQMLRFTSDAAEWAAASGAAVFTTLFRHLRHLWNWPSGTIPELAGWIRRDVTAAAAHCAAAGK
jgi:hypothetical protein